MPTVDPTRASAAENGHWTSRHVLYWCNIILFQTLSFEEGEHELRVNATNAVGSVTKTASVVSVVVHVLSNFPRLPSSTPLTSVNCLQLLLSIATVLQ